MVLMIVVKYLMGQFFFLMSRFRAVKTFAHHERYEVKGLRLYSPYVLMFWGTMSVHSVSLITYRVRSFCIMEGGGLAETRIQV